MSFCQWCDLPEEEHDEFGFSRDDYESGIAAEAESEHEELQ